MKQYIALAQLDELTEEQRVRLRDWWGNSWRQGDIFVCTGNHFLKGEICVLNGNNMPITNSLPLLSIGQMIELLESKTPDFDIHRLDIPGGLSDRNYKIVLKGHYNNLVFDADELAGALWNAVKEVL